MVIERSKERGEMQCDPSTKAALIEEVLNCLDAYRGERIIKDEHPLHKAVVALERVCIQRGDGRAALQPYKLWSAASRPWYRLVWKSRDNQCGYNSDYDPARELKDELEAELLRMEGKSKV